MSKILIMKGLPGSGKSTHAETLTKNGNWVRVNRDLIREMLHFNVWSRNNEKTTQSVQMSIVRSSLKAGLNVIIDDTNLTQKHIDRWKNVAKEYDNVSASVEFVQTPILECIARNKQRGFLGGRQVPKQVIWEMAREMDYPESHSPREIIVDVDGTVADIEHRRKWVTNGEKDWKRFFQEMDRDKLRTEVWNTILKDSVENNAEIVFISGRPDNWRWTTEDWMERLMGDFILLNDPMLFMRPASNSSPDTEIKQNILNKYFHKENILRVYDDRPSVIRMWRENGLEVVDVGDGEEF